MNSFNKSLVIGACFIVFMFVGVNGVGATTVTIDSNNNISMPENLYSDKDSTFEISNLANYASYYQIKDVTLKTDLVGYIDTLIDKQAAYDKETENLKAATDETKKAEIQTKMNEIDTTINTTKESIKEAVDDYTTSEWIKAEKSSIPSTSIKADNYYVVWVKATLGEDSYYDFAVYRAVDSDTVEKTTNPATGIETTFLYIGVALLIGLGSYLVINKNKERYE